MGIHVTKYETKNGKTRRVSNCSVKTEKADSPEKKTGEGKNNQPASPVKQGA